MSKKNKGQAVASLKDLAKKDETVGTVQSQSSSGETPPNKTTPPAARESKSFVDLKKVYDNDANRGLRAAASPTYVKWLLNKETLSWEEYCDVKIKAFTDYWTTLKTKPKGLRAPKVLTADELVDREKEMQRMRVRMANLEASSALTRKQTGSASPAPTPAPVGGDGEDAEETE